MTRAGRRVANFILFLVGMFCVGMGMQFYDEHIATAFIPTSTFTPRPTKTPDAYIVAQTKWAQTKAPCYEAGEVTAKMEGLWICTYGYVIRIDESTGTSIYFSNNPKDFHIYADGYFENISVADCVWGEGKVMIYKGVPYIQVNSIYISDRC